MTGFVHLRAHSEFSLVDSVVRVKPLVEAVAAARMPAVALTDQGNVSAMVKFYRAAVAAGVKPIVGADLYLADGADDRDPARFTLLCANRTGFVNLSRLITKSYAAGQPTGRALVQRDWLSREALEGLIGLSGAQRGDVGRALAHGQAERGAAVLERWLELMPGRFYVELQALGRPGESDYVQRAVELAASAGAPVVATNEVCFLTRDEFFAHETRVCIAEGRTLDDQTRARDYSEEQYLKTPDEMAATFAELPEALANTVEIAKRCNLELDLGSVYMPRFELPDGSTAAAQLKIQSEAGLEERLAETGVPEARRGEYAQRLERELGVICEMGFEGYFLIVADFIIWTKRNGIPVGPGRGSGAGSLVAYALGITNLDPIAHELLFERFLNPERVSMPDFDVDFCIEGRDRVIDYVADRYGRDRVAQIVTFGTMAARAVVRDVGRVLGMPYGYVDRIAKLIPFELGITLDKALEDDEELKSAYENEDDVGALIDRARQLEGLARNAGTHAGGVVIAPDPLPEFMPLYSDEDSSPLTQLDKDDLEAIGLIKFDFLGLKTLTIIDKAMRSVNAARAAAGEPPIDIDAVGVNDPAAYALLNTCKTTAVFQLESRGMRDLIKRLKPDNFDDLVAILALFRPGPLQSGMVDEFIDRKHGRATGFDYLHPSLEPVLRPTYGVILYQEQVMQIAQVLAGYTLGQADLLRRAMGKKKPEEMAKQREGFIAGATGRGVDAGHAAHIFDLVEKFAGYGFNKSHSASYALVAFQTAWLKAHYPEAFMAAVMSADMDNTDKLSVLKHDCEQLELEPGRGATGLHIDPPDVNRSAYEFTVGGRGRISYGLGAIKGVGRGVVEAIVTEREAHGPYADLVDFCRRLDEHKLSRRVLEALVKSGALDELGANRATLMSAIPDALQLAERSAFAQAAGQGALFGGDDAAGELEYEFTPLPPWTKRERLDCEGESLGLHLTGHLFDDYARHCEKLGIRTIDEVVANLPTDEQNRYRVRRDGTVAGVVMNMHKRGNRVTIQLDDRTGRIEATLFDEVYDASKHLIRGNAILVVDGQLRWDDFLNAWRINARRVRSVDEAIEEHALRLTISLNGEAANGEFIGRLKETLEPFRRGNCQVALRYRGPEAEAELTFGESWCVRPTRELLEELTRLLGEERYQIHYPRYINGPRP